ncbi:MAG: DNA-binding domain-containing protein [Roseovarius sp.]|nr:DNA-binding domain-containing protein [Roseovarius sp.]
MNVTQTGFHEALLDPSRPVPKGLSNGQGDPAGRRFSVYRNNVVLSLTSALETAFPAIAKLVGPENFSKVARLFLARHPPSSPLIMYYGEEFPDFLEGFEPLRRYGHLPDLARLEQARRESYHAADSTPVDIQEIQSLTPDQISESRYELAPTVRIIHSSWPIYDIWSYNIENGPEPGTRSQNVIVTRPFFDPISTPVSNATAKFAEAIQNGMKMGDAHDLATELDSDFNLSEAFGLLLRGHAIISINTGV